MLNFYRSWLAVVLVAVFYSNAATVHTISSGGEWADTLCWVGNTVPDAADSIVINGTVFISHPHTCDNLIIAKDATLQNSGSLGWVTLTITGNLENNGTIRDNPNANELWIDIGGDITNNGTWTPAKTHFSSTRRQTIAQSDETVFSGKLYKKSASGSADTFPLVAASDLNINAELFDCNGYADGIYFWGTIDMARHTLTLLGNTYLTKTILYGSDTLACLDSSSINSCTFKDSTNLAGHVTVTDARVTFNSPVTILGTLQNGGNLGWITVICSSSVINKGVIGNNPANNEIWLDCYGDITNSGTWAPAKTHLASSKSQTITQDSTTVFTGIWYKKSAAGTSDTFPLIAGSDLVMNVDRFDGNGSTDGTSYWGRLNMAEHSLALKGSTNLTNVTIDNINQLQCYDSTTFNSCTFEGPVALYGTATVIDAQVTFKKTVTINGTLQNGGSLGWVTLSANGGIDNQGLIRDNPKGGDLWIAIGKNVTNNGIWTNTKNTLLDSTNQSIGLEDGKSIAAPILIDALWASGPYSWQKESEDLSATKRILTFDSLTSADAGVYRCKHDSLYSRLITIDKGSNAPTHYPPRYAQYEKITYSVHAGKQPMIRFQTPQDCTYRIALYSLQGRLIALAQARVTAGMHSILVTKQPVAAGSYLLHFSAGTLQTVQRFLLTN